MGAQMAKAIGVYNEEEQINTPQGPHRYRPINIDPRSATVGIIRTPIQVECTPTNSKNKNGLHCGVTNKVIPTSKQEIENDKESVNESVSQDQMEVLDDYKEVSAIENVPVETEFKCYLETDIDKLDSNGCTDIDKLDSNESTDIDMLDSKGTNTWQSITEQNEKPIVELCDVRSPSLGISRTPVLVQCTPELFAVHARIESMSFCDFEVHTDDPSAIVSDDDPSAVVSDDDQSSPCHQFSIKNWLVDVENKANCDSPCNVSVGESPKTVAKKQKELNAMKKKLFFTPDVKDTTKPKARTPLGNLQASQLGDSPQKMIRAKQWRNIQEERQLRGIADTENTPPNLPPLSKVSSAPGKILDHKRTKTLWDDENTMFI